MVRSVGPYRGWILLGVVCATASAGAELAVPSIVRLLLDNLATHHGGDFLLNVSLLLSGAALAIVIFDGSQKYLYSYVANRILVDLRNEISAAMRRLPISCFYSERGGIISALFVSDAPAVAQIYQPLLGDAIISAARFVGALLILFFLLGRWALLAVSLGAIYLVVPLLLTKRVRAASRRVQESSAQLTAEVQESISATREVRAFNQDPWDMERLNVRFSHVARMQLRLTLFHISSSANFFLYWIVVALLYWLGGKRVLSGEMSLGSLVAFVWYFNFLEGPVRRLAGLNAQLQTALGAAERVFAFLDRAPTVPASQTRLLPASGRVDFEQVCFAYREGWPVLTDINLIACAGQRVAIVGPSGAGKSTLVNLLLRFYDPASGRILIDGQDIRQFTPESLRRHVGVVFQETFLFHATVRENIRFGKEDATEEEIIRAAKAANAHEFIAQLADGYDALVGERGAALSGGQKQRIAIARVILRDPRVLIFDEATSSLDAESELAVHQAVEVLMVGRTTFVIAHRLSTVLNADLILVLEKGRVLDCGSHAELLSRCGLYRKLCQLQFATEGAVADSIWADARPLAVARREWEVG